MAGDVLKWKENQSNHIYIYLIPSIRVSTIDIQYAFFTDAWRCKIFIFTHGRKEGTCCLKETKKYNTMNFEAVRINSLTAVKLLVHCLVCEVGIIS